ncbi:MAG: hypothetical protein ACXVE1_08060 [Gaiellaceae bacterium]
MEGVFHGEESIGLGSRLKDWIASLGHEQRELNRGRRTADAELRKVDSVPLRLAWRSAELTAGGERLELAHQIRVLVRGASPRYLPGAVPLARGAVRIEEHSLLALADRLSDLGRPVAPRGILLLKDLLVDSDSPLYLDSLNPLGPALATIAAALEDQP